MPKLTPEERAELEARLREDDEDDDTDDVEIGFKDGGYFRGSFRRAVQLGHVTLPSAKPDPEDKPAAKSGGAEVKRFAGRRIS